jgi:hypothetical protein
MRRCRIGRTRGIVLSAVRLTFADGIAPIDTSTEPGLSPGAVRLRTKPAGLAGGDVFQIDTPLYGAFNYVLISANGATGGVPAFGGFLFLPPPRAHYLDLVAFNVSQLDTSNRARCGNDHHAEMQVDAWLAAQDPKWLGRIHRITIENGSRQLADAHPGRLAYSPCRPCAVHLAARLEALNGGRAAGEHVLGRMSWSDLYLGGTVCNHPTNGPSLEMMVKAGWRLQGPLPAGIADTPANRPREGPDWPWSAEVLEPEYALS